MAQNFKEPDSVMSKLFPFSLKGEAKEWVSSLPLAIAKTWRKLEKAFLRKYYPIFWAHKPVNSIHVKEKTRSGEAPPVKQQVWVKKEKKVEEVKMLTEVKEPWLDLENCSLHELISILQKFASDPSINTNQAGLVLILLIMS